MPSRPEMQRRIAAARADFLDHGGRLEPAVSHLVAASWDRSRSAGVDATTLRAVYHEDCDTAPRLVRCAQPVLRHLDDETLGIPVSIALTDSKARILSRTDTKTSIGRLLDEVQLSEGFQYSETEVGTNGIGTVFESGQSVQIVGSEHFHEGLLPFACAGAPIRDPFSGRIEGVLDITCLAEHSSPLMHSLVRSATRDIEKNLALDRSHRQQALFDAFLRLDARTHGAVIATGGGVVMSNAHAQSLFTHTEQATIQTHAEYLSLQPGRPVDQIELGSGKVVRMRGTKVPAADDAGGVVLEVVIVSEAPTSTTRNRTVHTAGDPPPRTSPESEDRTPPRLKLPQSDISDYPSPLWRRAVSEIHSALEAQQDLLVLGATGAGKFSLVAETHHRLHPGGRSLAIDAADLARGSHGGVESLFGTDQPPTLCIFRNIDELSRGGVDRLGTLLRELAGGSRDVQVAATASDVNVDSELPFRDVLRHFDQSVTLPSLRHRRDDLPLLVTRVLATLSGDRSSVSSGAMRVLTRYSWPGNLHELEQVLSSALTKRPVGEIQADDLPGSCHQGSSHHMTVIEAHERDAIVQALHDVNGNRVQAAAALGIARSSLYRKIKQYGIAAV